MIYIGTDVEKEAAMTVAKLMAAAAKTEPKGCGYCGFRNCAEMVNAGANCAFNVTDLGIAVGSAVSVAADSRIDNRVIFSAGKAAVRLELMSETVRVCYSIPLTTASKSVFYDRAEQAEC